MQSVLKKKNLSRQITAFAIALIPIIAAAAPSAATYAVTEQYALGGSGKFDYLTLDAAARRLYIARGDRVMVVDADHGTLIGEVSGANGAHGVALVPALHRGYVSNGHADSLTPFDLGTLKPLPPVALSGKDADALIFDAATSRLWAFNGHSNNVSVVDPSSNKEVATIALAGKPEFAVVDQAGHIYVNIEDTAQIAQIDTHANKVLATWSLGACQRPTGLAIDVARHRLFSVCANRQMVVLDSTDGHHVADVAIGEGPDAAGYDAATQTVFSSNGDGTLTVIHQDDADHYSVVANVATQKGARTFAIDAQTHRLFVAAPNVVGDAKRPAADASFGVLVVGAH